MTKQETCILKGIALLMMFMIHIFDLDHDTLCTHFLYFHGTSFINFLSYGCNPINIFLIVGGYGLYCVYLKGKHNDKHHISRIVRLYEHYWIILVLFVPLTLWLVNRNMISGLSDIFWNLTAFDCTWNTQCWFMAPYAILSLSYPFLFSLLDKYGWKLCGVVTLLSFFLSSFVMSTYGLNLFHKGFFSLLNFVLYLSFSFYLGAVSKKYELFDRLRNLTVSKWLLFLILVAIILIRCFAKTRAFEPLYSYALIILILNIGMPKIFKTFFSFTGKHSMNMWFAHYWIYEVLLGKFVYGLKYWLFVLIAVYLLSLVVSYVVDGIAFVIRKI